METSANDFIAAIRRFLEVATGDGSAGPGNERELARALDRLALVLHGPDPAGPEPETLAPSLDRGTLRARLGARFPGLGWYRDGCLDLEGEFTAGDALDDLVDIVADLTDVLWLAEHTGPVDALWQLHFGFRVHWGAHLRGLQWYLHEREQARALTG